MDNSRVHIIVHGRVQGVFFRADTLEIAENLSISGWARNNPDGSLEIMAEGKRDDLRELIRWCKKGPSVARVEKVETSWEHPTGEFRGFEIRM